MTAKKLTFKISGMPPNDKELLLSDFIVELEALRNALRNTERIVTNKEDTVLYNIVELSLSSPASVTIRTDPKDPMNDYSDVIVDSFLDSVDSILKKSTLPTDYEYDHEALEAIKAIGSRIGKRINYVEIAGNGRTYTIRDDFVSKVVVLQGTVEEKSGYITGKMDAINIHDQARDFIIYPNVGPTKIRCHFREELKSQAIKAIDKYVSVFGILKYRSKSMYPFEIRVNEIEIKGYKGKEPKLSDLKGIEPNITGDLSPEEYVRKQRDEEW